MLVKILRLFGFDVHAKIEEAKVGLELRVEQATDYVKQVAQEAAMIAAFYLVATVAAASAVGIGLMAIYRWMTDDFGPTYGPYVGYATDGALLLGFAAVCLIVALIKKRSLANEGNKARVSRVSALPSTALIPAAPAKPAAPPATVADLAEPLSLILSRYVKSTGSGNPIINDLVGKLGTAARGTADDALERAAHVVRYGDSTSVFVVLIGAAALGWMISPHSKPSST
jgi:hypothetical protein